MLLRSNKTEQWFFLLYTVLTTSVSRLSQEHSSNEETKSAVYNDAQLNKEQTIQKIDRIGYTETLL